MRTSSQKRLWKWAATILISPEGCIPAMFPICLYATVYMYRDLMFVEQSWKGKHISNEGNILSCQLCISFFIPGSYLPICDPGQEQKITSVDCSVKQIALTKNFKSHLTQLWVSSLRFFVHFHDFAGGTSCRYSRWGPQNRSFYETPGVFFNLLALWFDLF